MKKVICLLSLVVCFFAGLNVVEAQTELNTTQHDSYITVLYDAPNVRTQITRPLTIKTKCVDINPPLRSLDANQGHSLWELFIKEIPNPISYEILSATRVIEPNTPSCGTIWFTYIEKHYIVPTTKSLISDRHKK